MDSTATFCLPSECCCWVFLPTKVGPLAARSIRNWDYNPKQWSYKSYNCILTSGRGPLCTINLLFAFVLLFMILSQASLHPLLVVQRYTQDVYL